MRVLIGCESSGRVREAFRRRGHEAWSCDLLPADDGSAWHFKQDVREVLMRMPRNYFDLFIVHPECTYLCVSGLHWNIRRPERAAKTEEALEFVSWLFEWGPKQCNGRMVLENPRGCITSRLGFVKAQTIQPHEYGEDASKATDLWIVGEDVPLLVPTKHVPPRMVNGKLRWANQTDSGQNRLGPSEDRWKLRSETYPGIADAMADQYGRIAI